MLRNLIYIRFPAVTNVEQWTNDEPEVGAIIAIDNQVEKGICALLVKELLITKKLLIQSESNDNLISVISKLLVYEDRFFDLIESLIFLL